MIETIKAHGAVLAGDTVGDGQTWQKVALTQAHELRHYATALELIAAGHAKGPVVFPAWDKDSGDTGRDELLAACRKMIAADDENDEIGKRVAILAISRAVAMAEGVAER
jgi:hypothetical protein